MGAGPNFDEVMLTADGTKVLVVGNSIPGPPGSELRVVIHDVNDVHKRLEGQVPPPIGASWQAVLDQPNEAPFAKEDTVVVVGREISEEGGSFMWANQLTIG
jgi:hypothetical protein